MAPKKDKAKGGDDAAASKAGGAFTEVERTFLELQVAECNRKIARLRAAVDEYEQRNEQLQKDYENLDEDRADIIAYLKKTLSLKNEENIELKDKVQGLEETREIETAQFKETVDELEKNFRIMKEQLSSENKLLAGKLNTLEEFRAIRDDLMKKFENQEQAFKDQETKYKKIIYEAEKNFVISKDKLKKEMEGRLLQLAQDFQDATELRIAASTLRLIRENIAVNNELDSLLATQAKLADQNEKLKDSEHKARAAKEVAEVERDKAINKNIIQLKVIDQLTNAFQEIKKDKALHDKKSFDLDTLRVKVQQLTKDNEDLTMQVNILKQRLHSKMSDQNKSTLQSSKIVSENEKLKKTLKDAAFAVQASLKLDQYAASDPARDMMDRQALLSRLLDIVTQYRDVQRSESLETIASFGKVYEAGDLGFIPKVGKKKSTISSAVSRTTKPGKELLSEKRSTSAISVTTSSLGSVKTIPSLKIIPPVLGPEVKPEDSLPSFVSSIISSEIGVTEKEEPVETEIEKQLEASKLEIQKSILKDLAYSQMALTSQAKFMTAMTKPADQSTKFETIDEKAPIVEPKSKSTEAEPDLVEKTQQEHIGDEKKDETSIEESQAEKQESKSGDDRE